MLRVKLANFRMEYIYCAYASGQLCITSMSCRRLFGIKYLTPQTINFCTKGHPK
jgi:hypothetical protein